MRWRVSDADQLFSLLVRAHIVVAQRAVNDPTCEGVQALRHDMERVLMATPSSLPITLQTTPMPPTKPPTNQAAAPRPPLGLKPEQLWEEERGIEIMRAIIRYVDAGMTIPGEWLVELRKRLPRTGP